MLRANVCHCFGYP